ncbi:hypothetical protein ACWJJH_09890 [Endozoicomonadaceae bacterium StTr2]
MKKILSKTGFLLFLSVSFFGLSPFSLLAHSMSEYDYICVIPVSPVQCYFGIAIVFDFAEDDEVSFSVEKNSRIKTKSSSNCLFFNPDLQLFSIGSRVRREAIFFVVSTVMGSKKIAVVFVNKSRDSILQNDYLYQVSDCWYGNSDNDFVPVYTAVGAGYLSSSISRLRDAVDRRISQAMIDALNYFSEVYTLKLANRSRPHFTVLTGVFSFRCNHFGWGWQLQRGMDEYDFFVSVLSEEDIRYALDRKRNEYENVEFESSHEEEDDRPFSEDYDLLKEVTRWNAQSPKRRRSVDHRGLKLNRSYIETVCSK